MSWRRSAYSRRGVLTSAAATAGLALSGGTATATHPASTGSANGRLYEIRHGRHRAVVAGVAATLLSWTVDGTEVLLTHAADDIGEGYQGKTILPWPNRIDQGRYRFHGKQYQLPINEPEREAALHGLMSFVEWSPVRHCADSVELEYLLHPQYGFPFSLLFSITFTAGASGIRSTLTVTNVGDIDAPFGTANHTYIAAAGASIDPMLLHLPASTYYLTNDRLIPTGTTGVDGTEYDFRTPRRLGSTRMDTAFTDLARGPDGTAVVRFGRPGGTDVELWMDESYRYLQVYTDDFPETDRPARAGLTVEPVTCAPNALNTGDGLITVAPGRSHRASWGFRVPDGAV